jgi:hypothetical protein
MKNPLSLLLCALAVQLISVQFSYAQQAAPALKSPTAAVTIDGNNKEWGNDLAYYNADKNIHYTISNDKDYLYLVVKTNNERQLNNILLSGITFSIDTKGRKRKTYSVTFPVQEMSITNNTTFKTLEEKLNVAKFTKSRKIQVSGFKDINEDILYTGNIYKIQTALNFDDNGFLVYEEAIPLSLFHSEELVNNEWAYNIELNAVTALLQPNGKTSVGNVTISSAIVAVPAGSGPPSSSAVQSAMRNSSYSANAASSEFNNIPPRNVEIARASDFWGKFSLAK